MHTLYKYNVKEEMDSSPNNENSVIIYSIHLTSFQTCMASCLLCNTKENIVKNPPPPHPPSPIKLKSMGSKTTTLDLIDFSL